MLSSCCFEMGFKIWCEEGDLNPHAFRHTPLKRCCESFVTLLKSSI